MKRKRTKVKTARSSLLPVYLIVAGVLLVVAMFIWQAANSSRAASAPTPAAAQVNDPNLPFPEVERISVEASKQALDEQSAVFLDVRDPGSYSMGRIPGAMNIPLDEVENRAGELDPNQRIIIYCT